MTDMTSFRITDGVDYPLAVQMNRALDSTLRAEISNATTMAGTVTLTDADTPIQRFLCNGSNRIVKLPAQASGNHPYLILNLTAATYTLDVQNAAGISLIPTPLVALTGYAYIIPDGTAGFVTVSTSSSSGGVGDGWTATNATLTYTSADGNTGVVSTSVDLTGAIGVGDKLRITNSTVKYFIVTAITASTMTFWGGTDYTLTNTTISSPSYSHVKNPFGFPASPSKWTVETTNTSACSKATPTQNTWYGDTGLSATGPNIIIPIGLWKVEYQTSIDGSKSSTTAMDVYSTLSTASNSESDVDFTCWAAGNGASGLIEATGTIYRTKILSLASKTTYYLNIKTDVVGTGATITLQGSISKIFIRAICAYL